MKNSFYDDLIADITKQASAPEDVSKKVNDMDTNELVRLATELAGLTGDEDLARMAQILPVYASSA